MYKKIHGVISILVILLLSCAALPGCAGGKISTDKEAAASLNSKSAEVLKPEMIKKDNILSTIKDLSSERFKGRLAGTEESLNAADYIWNCYKKMGLVKPDGLFSYRWGYLQPTVQLADKPVMQIIDTKGRVTSDFGYPENFVLRRLSSETGDIDMKSLLYLVEDINALGKGDISLEGKILLIPWQYRDMLENRSIPEDLAEKYGAAGVIGEYSLKNNTKGYGYLPVTSLAGPWLRTGAYKPLAMVDSDTFAKLAAASRSGGRVHFACSSNVNIHRIAFNTIGMIPGSDPTLKNEYIIIGAHFDSAGDNMNGSYNPGALDNASGVSAMLELARVIKESGVEPKKTILFIAFNGEESGNTGSDSYVRNPLYPLDRSIMINLDMIGSKDTEPLTLTAASAGEAEALGELLAGYAGRLGIPYVKKTGADDDSMSFQSAGVPSVSLSYPDFKAGIHSPHDTIESVDGDKAVKAVELLMNYIRDNAY